MFKRTMRQRLRRFKARIIPPIASVKIIKPSEVKDAWPYLFVQPKQEVIKMMKMFELDQSEPQPTVEELVALLKAKNEAQAAYSKAYALATDARENGAKEEEIVALDVAARKACVVSVNADNAYDRALRMVR